MSWVRATFKGKDVWARVGADGGLDVDGGRVPIRYSPSEGAKIYRAGASRIEASSDAPVQLPDGISADAKGKGGGKKGKSSGFGSAGTRTAAQAAMAASAARQLITGLPQGTAIAFTDGACKGNPGPAGAGACVQLPDGRRAELSLSLGTATNNVGELTAVGLALDALDHAEWPADAPVALFSDSKYANGVLTQGWKAKANRELILGLRERLSARPGLDFHWIAGHVGVDGNERADALANDGVAGRTETRWSQG